MNKKSAFKVCLLASTLISAAAFAAPTVTFQGEVTAQTCSINVNSTTNAVVLMPTISVSDLYTDGTSTTAVGNTAGLTPFTISVTGCTASGTPLTMYPEFLGTSVNTTTFALGNTAGAPAASGVGIALYSDADGTDLIELNGITRGPALTLAANATSVETTYSAQYMATDTTTTAGKVTSVAEYTLTYL